MGEDWEGRTEGRVRLGCIVWEKNKEIKHNLNKKI